MKTTINCFSNSYAHSKSRNKVIDGTEVSWKHIARLHAEDIAGNETVPGFYGKLFIATIQTRRLVYFMNRYFDCLNVSKYRKLEVDPNDESDIGDKLQVKGVTIPLPNRLFGSPDLSQLSNKDNFECVLCV